uniref:Uncharacterized protein n=1 Tax=Rhizophora mucronata TaxID=61149 RepID=A0A2P2R252_RHIMU
MIESFTVMLDTQARELWIPRLPMLLANSKKTSDYGVYN